MSNQTYDDPYGILKLASEPLEDEQSAAVDLDATAHGMRPLKQRQLWKLRVLEIYGWLRVVRNRYSIFFKRVDPKK